MKILSNTNQPNVALVVCIHGDEQFGLEIYTHFEKQLERFPELMLVIANEPAIAENKRFISEDLNRIFPGEKDASGEKGIAFELYQLLKNVPYVLDIHTTYAEIEMIPIVTSVHTDIKKVLNLTKAKEIAFVQPDMAAGSCISLMKAGVSLEYGRKYSEKYSQAAIVQVEDVIEGLLNNQSNPVCRRELFYIDGVIEKTVSLPEGIQDCVFSNELGVYPFLLSSNGYEHIYAMSAKEKRTVIL